MSKTTGFVMFVLGAAVGSVATWQYAKKNMSRLPRRKLIR